ncbi:MAG: PA2779 family protein [Nitrospirae bacterium]|nr:PA2779 family protein [Nitrospirota bacterium]
MRIPCMRFIAWYLVLAMFVIGIAPKVDAGLVKSEIVPSSYVDRAADLEKIQKVLETKAISKRLEQLGLSQYEIQKRLGQLNDNQIHQLALQIDDLRVGKDDGLGLIIALLIIAILVVILLQLTGHRIIVTK